MNESFLNGAEIVENITAAFNEHLAAVKANVGALGQLNSQYGKLPSDYLKTIKQITDAQVKQAKAERELANASAASTRAKIAEASLRIKENAELREQIRLQQAQEKQVRATGGSYQQLSAELNANRAAAKNLAADIYILDQAGEKGSATYNQLQTEFSETQSKVTQLDTTLKGIDASLGQHGRFVGNYATGWNGLSNSINQVTRELPAFAVSANTGFLAISNNLPILVDEISRLNAQNRELVAQGQPIKSVLSQITASLFSWQTALSVGVTLLTLYGGKLIEWATSAKSATREIDQLAAATDRYNDTLVETTTNSEVELTALRYKLAVAKDLSKSDKERAESARELIELYPGYLEGLSKEAIMLQDGKQNTQAYNKAMSQLTKDIQARIDAEAKQKASRESLKIAAELEQEVKIRERLNAQAREYYEKYGDNSAAAKAGVDGLRQQVKARQELLKEDQTFISQFGKLGVTDTGSVDMLGLYEPAQITELALRAQALKKEVEKQQAEIAKAYQDTSLLDYDPEKKDPKEIQYEHLVDFAASEYELNKTRLENEAKINEAIFKDEEQNFDKREQAAGEYQRVMRELAQLNLTENLRLVQYESKQKIDDLKRRLKDGEITQKNSNDVIASIQKQAGFDSLLAYENYAEEMRGVTKSLNENLKGVFDGVSDQQKLNTIDSQALDDLRQMNLESVNLSANSEYKVFKNLEDRKTELSRKENEKRIQLNLQRVASDIARVQQEAQLATETEKKNALNAELEKLVNKQIGLQSDLAQAEQERINKTTQLTLELKRATDEYLNSITSGFLGDLGLSSLNQFLQKGEDGLSQFEKRFKGAGDNITKQFAVTFSAITEVAQQAFAFMNQNSQAQFDAEQVRLERRKDLAIKYAGENQAAQDEINRQYEDKSREIRRRELEAQKEQAIFNAVINTAQAITAALPNIPLSILVGALGAAQIAFISAQSIPAYAEGGITEQDGNILVNDAKRSDYREVLQTPDGKTIKPQGRNRVLNVPKGTRIFKSYADHDKQLAGILETAGIGPASEQLNRTIKIEASNNSGYSKEDLRSVMQETFGAMNKVSHNVVIDHNGINAKIEHGHSDMELRNAVLGLKGQTFGR